MVTNNSCDYSPTQYNVQTGGANGTLNNVTPSATSGVPVISQGSSSQPVFGTAVVAGGGTGDTSFTAYSVICGGTTSTAALQSVASVGTSGQVLTSNGAGALPTFQAAGSGSLVKISTQTANNSASISFTSAISGTYNSYLLLYNGVQPATDNAILNMTVSSDNGVTYLNTGYQSGCNETTYDSASFSNFNSTSLLQIGNGTGSAEFQSGSLYFSVNGYFLAWGQEVRAASGGGGAFGTMMCKNTSASVNAIKFAMSAGNITSGTFTLYGLVQ